MPMTGSQVQPSLADGSSNAPILRGRRSRSCGVDRHPMQAVRPQLDQPISRSADQAPPTPRRRSIDVDGLSGIPVTADAARSSVSGCVPVAAPVSRWRREPTDGSRASMPGTPGIESKRSDGDQKLDQAPSVPLFAKLALDASAKVDGTLALALNLGRATFLARSGPRRSAPL